MSRVVKDSPRHRNIRRKTDAGLPATVARWLCFTAKPKDVDLIPAAAAAFPKEAKSENIRLFEISLFEISMYIQDPWVVKTN